MKPPKIEPLTNIINIAILLWPSSSNPDIVNSVGIGITEDSKLFMNRPINPSFTKYGLFRNMVLLPIVITSIIIIANLIQAFSDFSNFLISLYKLNPLIP